MLYKATEDDTHYVSAGAFGAGKGTYKLSVTEVNTQTAGTDTRGTVPVDGSVTGEIDFGGDRDWFAVTLEAGTTYRIDLEGASTGAGTLADPYLRGIYDSRGTPIGGTTDDNDGVHLNSQVFFAATEGGIHYLSAGAEGSETGTYRLSVTDVVAADAQTAGTDTTGTVRASGSVTGEIDYASDRDWFAVTLQAGKSYRIDLEGSPTGAGTLDDPYLFGVHDSAGNPIGGTTDDDSGVSRNSRVDFEPTEGGTYYVSAGADGIDTGTYTLSIEASRGIVDTLGSSDGGTGRSIVDTLGSSDGGTGRSIVDTLGSSDGGTGYRLRAHDITETRDAADDYLSATSTTGVVMVGGSVTGDIERSGDRDWFAVDLVAGRTYRFDLEGVVTNVGTLEDPYLHGIHNSQGILIGDTTDDDGGVLWNSRVFFSATEGSTYYVSAGGDESGRTYSLGTFTYTLSATGTYRLSVREIEGAQTAGTDTSGTVLVGGSVEDQIDFPNDRDWFAVTLVAGRTYRIDLEGSLHGHARGVAPLFDPYLHGIYDSQGTLIGGTTDDDGGSGRNSRVLYEATKDGTHYVSAGADGRGTGTYRLSVTDAYPADAQTAGTNTSGTVSVGDSVTKKIDYADDRDWFAVTLEAGKTYRFDLEGTSTGAGTLADPYLRGIYNSQGILIGGTTGRR